jgi:hypothetical protein
MAAARQGHELEHDGAALVERRVQQTAQHLGHVLVAARHGVELVYQQRRSMLLD